MAPQQTKRHALGRTGQQAVQQILGGEQQTHKAPFDIVDFRLGYAYEVKTMSAFGVDLKVHISDESYERKQNFLATYPGLKGVLIAVVIYTPAKVELYKAELTHSIRIDQMERIN